MSKSDFIAYIRTLKPEDWNKKATEKWTVKDVVAHMIGWEKGDPEIIKETWKSKRTPWFYETNEFDEFNKNAVEFYKQYMPEQLIGELGKWQKKVKEDIDSIGEDKLRNRPDLFGWLFDESDDSHYSHHYRQIKNTVERG